MAKIVFGVLVLAGAVCLITAIVFFIINIRNRRKWINTKLRGTVSPDINCKAVCNTTENEQESIILNISASPANSQRLL